MFLATLIKMQIITIIIIKLFIYQVFNIKYLK